MKSNSRTAVLCFCLLPSAFCLRAPAQGTAFTYQGRLSIGTNPATGTFDLRFAIYDSTNNPGILIAGPITNAPTGVTNGLFTVMLDFGGSPFNGADRWLEIAVRSNGLAPFAVLAPRQPITPAPYALSAANLMSPANAPLAITVNGQRVLQFEPNLSSPNIVGGYNGNAVIAGVDAAVIVGGGRPGAVNYAGEALTFIGGGWANTNNGGGAMIGGGFLNRIESGSFDSVIAGGRENTILSNSVQSALGGGYHNSISNAATYSTIGGGRLNVTAGNDTTVGGGGFNLAAAQSSTVAGGFANQALETDSTVGGGYLNTASGIRSTVGGGSANVASGTYATVAGGTLNTNEGVYGFIGSGQYNLIQPLADNSVIAGGYGNTIVGSEFLFVFNALGGGRNNLIATNVVLGVIGGGDGNSIQNAAGYGTIPGGQSNVVAASYGFAAGRRAQASHDGAFVWSDSQNADFPSTAANEFAVRAAGGVRWVTGGAGMRLDGAPVLAGAIAASNVNAASFSNTFWKVDGNAGTIAGTHFVGTTDNQPLVLAVNGARALRLESGYTPSAPNVNGGSSANYIAPGLGSVTIAGGGQDGLSNSISANAATIGGGRVNTILANAIFSTIAGGEINTIQTGAGHAVIAGGATNTIGSSANWAAIGGGQGNTASGNGATVPGGANNTAGSSYSFAAGHRAKALSTGSFVWADSQNADFGTTAADQFLIRAAGGVGINTSNTVQALTVGPAETPLNTGSQIGVYDGTQAFIVTRQTTANVEATFGVDGNRGVVAVLSDHPLVFRAGNGSGGGNVEYMRINTNGFVGIGTTSPTNKLHVAGGVSATAFVSTSDRNAKENFRPVSPRDVLSKVAALPISTWDFKDLHDGRHMGPVAQDFYAAFGLGGSDKTITTVDPDGVALAAIQGLNQEVQEQRTELKQKEIEIAQLRQRLETLEKIIRNRQPN